MRRLAGLVAEALERPLVAWSGDTWDGDVRDAIVVLGAPLAPGGALSDVLAERVDAAAGLWRAGAAPRVIASGGITQGAPRAEADALAEALRAAGIPDVLVERGSRTTRENARETRRLLGPAPRVWLVTQPFHARRAVRAFREADIDARAWHIAGSVQYRDRPRALRWLVREYAAWAKALVR